MPQRVIYHCLAGSWWGADVEMARPDGRVDIRVDGLTVHGVGVFSGERSDCPRGMIFAENGTVPVATADQHGILL